MRIPIERYGPPGVDIRRESLRTAQGLLGAAFLSLRFLPVYWNSRAALYTVHNGVRVLDEGVVMPTFREIFSWSFLGFWIFFAAMAAVAVLHVVYHYQGGSRPVYLMRRLPDRWEYWRRCLALPAAGALCALAAMALLLGAYLAIYLLCTPAQCLPEPWF